MTFLESEMGSDNSSNSDMDISDSEIPACRPFTSQVSDSADRLKTGTLQDLKPFDFVGAPNLIM